MVITRVAVRYESGSPGNLGLKSSIESGDMRRRRVEEILQPYKEGMPPEPSVRIGDKIIRAIELMVTNDLNCIVVLQNNRPVGIVRLEEAFKKIGLQVHSRK